MDVRYNPVTEWNGTDYQPTGDLNATYINAQGAELGGYIWLLHDLVSVGVVGISFRDMPFGARAVADGAINRDAYRAKVLESARAELERQFAATDRRSEG